MKYYAVRNLNEDEVCITNKKPVYTYFLNPNYCKDKEWLFTQYNNKNKNFWKTVHVDVFKKLTGLKPPKEGKDGMIIIPEEKMKFIKLL